MARRYTALGRSWRRKEAADEVLPPPPPSNPPPPLPLAPQGPWRAKKPTNYRLQTDFKFLEREKKVSAVLDNSTFRQELEGILQGQLEGKNRPAPLTRPSPDQWLSDQRPQRPGITDQQVGVAVGGGERVIPINDLRGAALAKYTVAQRETRCKLAAVYRLADMFGWNKITHTHITVRHFTWNTRGPCGKYMVCIAPIYTGVLTPFTWIRLDRSRYRNNFKGGPELK